MTRGFFVIYLAVIIAAAALTIQTPAATAQIDTPSSSSRNKAVLPPNVTERYEYYEVCGCCEDDLHCEMKRKGVRWNDGKKYDSVTNWKIKWDYDHNRTGQTCSPVSFRVTVDVTFRFPKWTPPKEAPGSLVRKWDAYMKNLVVHEKGHRDIAVKAAEGLTRDVASLLPAPTCSDLDRSIRDLSGKRMEELERGEKKYDAKTDHGYTQGAKFP